MSLGLTSGRGDCVSGRGQDIGVKSGKYYSVNCPLKEGMDDKSYKQVFQPVLQKVMEVYRPGAVVLQCGADSLTGDRLGCFNLTLKARPPPDSQPTISIYRDNAATAAETRMGFELVC